MLRNLSSIRIKLLLIVTLTSMAALLVAGVVLVLYDVRSQRDSLQRDLTIQAEIVGRASAPAIVFGDSLTAHQSLASLAIRPEVLAAAVYTAEGRLFASFARSAAEARFPPNAPPGSVAGFASGELVLARPIQDIDGRVGTVYLRARFDRAGRIASYLPVVAAILLLSMFAALVLTYRMQFAVTRPVLEIAEVAREVRARRDYSLRVPMRTRDETGQLVDAFNAMLAEVSEAHASLLNSIQRKDEFLATMAHELRNPLGPIRNAAQYLLLRPPEAEMKAGLELIDRQVQQMARLIEDLLDISRLTRGVLELRRTEFTVGRLVRDVVESVQFAIRDAGQDLRLEVGNSDLPLIADRARLVQIVANLMNNAIKFTPRGGRITLAIQSERRDLVIRVTDTGIGIPPESLRDIFEPFSQLDRSLEKTQGGLGIGLALSRYLVELHGGTLVAASDGPNRGSTFRATLPIVSDALPVAAPVADSPRGAVEGRAILVADDNTDAGESLAMLLRSMGHEVSVARDGVEALDCFQSRRFDAAIIDIGMPRLNGYDVARRIRESPQGAAIRLIALTGWGQSEDREHAYQAGFDHHLTKPVEIEQLASLLASYFGRRNGNPAG